MPISTVSELESYLIEQRLVDPRHVQECRRGLAAHLSIEALIRSLEQRTFLTSYQTQKLLKRDTEGLRLGPYKLLYRNASGSFARVFRGCSVDDGKVVAIKLLRQRYAEDPRAVQLFKREGELGKRLKHKNIVPIYEVASEGQQHYFAMEFVEGGNFRDFIKIRKKFSPADATQYVLDMAEGLEYALSFGLTHRDLKLSNVLLSAQGVAKLVDFGLAGQDASLASMEEEVDRAIEYATLEKGTGAPDNDPRSDLYFLGAIYYELLTGVPPYPATRSRDERRQFSRYRDIRPIRSVDPSLPRSIEDIVDRLLAVSPAERYQTPTQVIADLRLALGKPIESDPVVASSDSGSMAASNAATNTILCVETRPKQQDALREYFSKHGYRVLVLTDPLRALNRVDTEPLAGLLIIGEAVGDEVTGVYQAATSRCKKRGVPLILALSPKLAHLKEKLSDAPRARVLAENVTLRKVRETLAEIAGGAPLAGGRDSESF